MMNRDEAKQLLADKLDWFKKDLAFTAPELMDLKWERFQQIIGNCIDDIYESLSKPEKIYVPFTADQVRSLNQYQHFSIDHPYTCGNDSSHRVLMVNTNGWECPDCSYTQGWAHKWHTDWEWKTK